MKFFFRRAGAPTGDYREIHQATDDQLRACREYRQHLDLIAPRLPAATKSFVAAPWYHDWNHHDCPHDSWLMNLSIGVEDAKNKKSALSLKIVLLGAYHDRILTFEYRNVLECNFGIQNATKQNMGDFLRDEFDVFDGGLVSHEILWQFGTPWKIVADQIYFLASPIVDSKESCEVRL
jgi:hypothetical protein